MLTTESACADLILCMSKSQSHREQMPRSLLSKSFSLKDPELNPAKVHPRRETKKNVRCCVASRRVVSREKVSLRCRTDRQMSPKAYYNNRILLHARALSIFVRRGKSGVRGKLKVSDARNYPAVVEINHRLL